MSDPGLTLVDARLVLEDRVLEGGALTVRGARIETVGELPPAGPGEVWDAAGAWVVPGLVDIHVHGAGGRSFNDASPEAWTATLDAHARAGTTTLLATVATAPWDELLEALAVGARLYDRGEPGLAGLHLEGPYLHPDQKGAHGEPWLRVPADGSWRELDRFRSALRLVTLAPELDGAGELIASLAADGILVAAGHSTATPEVVAAAAKLGLCHFTHLWSGQTRLSQHGPWRRIGLLETALASHGMSAELIADGAHAPAELTRIAYRCFGADRLCLISDASAGAGLECGCHFRMGSASGVVADGVALSDDGESFCGSTSFLSRVLHFAHRGAGLPLVECVRMASATPARLLGLGDRLGRLAPGLDADLVVLDQDLRVRSVMRKGRWLETDAKSRIDLETEVETHG